MPTAIRKLGTVIFVIGCIAVIGGLVPVAAGRVEGRSQQVWLAAAVVGALLAASGLVTDWLGNHAVRDQQSAASRSAGGSGGYSGGRGESELGSGLSEKSPPSIRLSGRPTGRGFRDDLMA